MASLEQRNGIYRVVFRCGGQKFTRSLKTRDQRAARVDLGTMELPTDCDVTTVLLSSGKISHRPMIQIARLGKILDSYLKSIPENAIEKNTRSMHSEVDPNIWTTS